MNRLSRLLVPVVLTAVSLAQSVDTPAVREGKYALITLTKYCDAVENFSNAEEPRLFAQVTAPSSDWIEFSNTDAWKHAGKPHPAALVWYKDDKIARVAITARDGDVHSYTDYCYRPDGSLARLRSMPKMRADCDQSLLHCSFTFRRERLYPPKISLTSTDSGRRKPFVVQSDDWEAYGPVLRRPLQSETTSFSFPLPDSPEYLSVSDLPFNRMLSVSTK